MKCAKGLSAEAAGILVLGAMVVLLGYVMHASGEISGLSIGEQLQQALFVVKDWE